MQESIRIEAGNVKALLLPLIGLLMLVGSDAFCAFERTASDPVAAAMGRAGLILSRSGGFLANPAIPSRTSATLWWDRPYGLRELGGQTVVGSYSPGNKAFGFSASQVGDEAYAERQIVGAGSFEASPSIRAGLSAAWNSLAIQGLPSGNAPTVNLGVVGQVSQDLSAGLAWSNLFQSRLSNYEDKLPTALSAGVLFQPDNRTQVALDIEQQPDWPTEVRMGAGFAALKQLVLRGGARFNPSEYTAGFTLIHRIVRLHYALMWHRDLGASHSLGLDILFR